MYEFSQRDGLALVGVASVFSTRHFYRARQLWPFRVSKCTPRNLHGRSMHTRGRQHLAW
jgi:hypothetical protein